MLHVGMDMHKKFSVVTAVNEDGDEVISGKRLNHGNGEVEKFFSEHREDTQVVLEAGSNWYWMCDLLDELGIPNRLCHPLSILANLDRMDFVPESYITDIKTRHSRELLRYRAALVKIQTGIKNRVQAILAKNNISNPYSDLFGKAGTKYLSDLNPAPVYRQALDGYTRQLDALSTEIERAEKSIAKTIKSTPETTLLETIPGVGPVRALTIASEIGDIGRFHSAKHLASYAGLVPSTSQSGESTHHGKITRQGSRWLRWSLVEAAIHVVGKPGPLRDFYLRLSKRKGKKAARVAVARKLATYIYHMLNEGKDYSSVLSYSKRSGVSSPGTMGK
jgi:transposase